MQSLRGRVVVITGAASGIGLGFAHAFASEGMKIVMADIEGPVLEHAAAQVAESGAEVLAVPTDCSLRHSVEALRDAAVERFGGVHVLCNNAGVGSRGLRIRNPVAPIQ